MTDLKQKIIEFKHNQNFGIENFFISSCNKHVLDLLNLWPNWERKFLNIIGDNYSGKTHLMNIFLKKFKGIKFEATFLNNDNLESIKRYQNIVLENLNNNIDEKLIYTLINIIDQDDKYLVVTSKEPIAELKFGLVDLKSRAKNFLMQKIERPDDELMFALILKNLSDRQISLDKKLINYIIKKIDRSYRNIFEFIYKVDQMSLKKKKSINLKIIKEVLGE